MQQQVQFVDAAAAGQVLASDAAPERVNLLGLSPARMAEFCVSLGEKPFRAQQLLQWVHQRGVTDFSAMTNMSKALREKLAQVAEVRPPEVVYDHESADGTRKWVIRVTGGSCVETVFIPDKGRGTLCVSSQVGCMLDCSFCSTGKQGFQRNLSTAEIIGQVWVAARALRGEHLSDDRAVTNVVMMGMGEPLLNFDNVVDAMQLMLNDFAYGLSKRRVTLSTAGVVPALDQLGEVIDVSLAVSLHAPNDALRDQLVPVNRRYPIQELLAGIKRYFDKLDDRRVVTIEYTLLAGVNDQPEHARELIQLLSDTPCKINLIPFNPFPGSPYERPSNNAVRRFQTLLAEAGFTAPVRTTRGDDIDAACGQLVGQVADKTRRSERHRSRQAGKQLQAEGVARNVR